MRSCFLLECEASVDEAVEEVLCGTGRSCFWLSLSSLSSLINGAAVGTTYRLSRRYFFEEFRAKVESIAATIASQIDGDLYRQMQLRPDQQPPEDTPPSSPVAARP